MPHELDTISPAFFGIDISCGWPDDVVGRIPQPFAEKHSRFDSKEAKAGAFANDAKRDASPTVRKLLGIFPGR